MTLWPGPEAGTGLAALDRAGPLVMGVLNTTPDSFSDGGRWGAVDAAVSQALRMVDEGADLIDVGGESSRPGAEPVSLTVELDRVLPVIERIADRAVVSIDTAKPEIADRALAAGAVVVNDITASLEAVAADHDAGWIAMQMKGEPRTMHLDPEYEDVVAEVTEFLVAAGDRGRKAGVPRTWIDPGIGFGKSIRHNLELLRATKSLVATGLPVVVGVSRKGFIGQLHAASDGVEQVGPDDRLAGSVLAAAFAARAGAHIVRVHDVRATARAVDRLNRLDRAPGHEETAEHDGE